MQMERDKPDRSSVVDSTVCRVVNRMNSHEKYTALIRLLGEVFLNDNHMS